MRWLLGCLLALLIALPAPAVPRPILRPALAPVYRWETFADGSTDQVALMQRAGIGRWVQVGVYDFDAEEYRPLVNGVWLPAATPPVQPLERHRRRHPRRPRRPHPRANYGIDVEKLATPPKPVYTDQDGKKVSREDAIKSIGAPAAIPNDGALPFFTAKGGTPEQRAKIIGELAATGQANRFRVASYADDTWQMKRGGFAPGLQVYVQAPDGKVLSRTPGDPGPAGVKQIIGRLWEPRKDYNPAGDPDLTKDSSPLSPLAAGGAAGMLFACGGALLMVIAGAHRAAKQE